MTVSDTPGAPCWIELFTPDQAGAVAFYTELFGWTAEEPNPDFGGYVNFQHNGQRIAGCMQSDGNGPDAWSVYLETSDLAETLGKVRSAGGQVVLEPVQVGPLGHMAFIVDAAGAALGLWQPLEHQGFATRGEVGAPAWFETLSNDYPASVAFYETVFDWDTHTMSDTDDFRYTTLGEGDSAIAGIMDATDFLQGAPTRWQFYIEVADADAAVAQTLAAGGKQVMPAMDSPYGRVAPLEDPFGVAFTVMSSDTGA